MAEKLRERFHKGKALLLPGARQGGKTTLLKGLFSGDDSVLWLSGGEPDVRLIATGSSAFELANEANEPLTGRKVEFGLHPLCRNGRRRRLALREAAHPAQASLWPLPGHRDPRRGGGRIAFRTLRENLRKDILMADKIKKGEGIMRLLQAIAYQIGSEVSMSELAQISGLDPKTVDRYVTMLEQAYIVFRLPSFSRNLRNELKHSRKIFFWDNGIRNAVIRNYAPIEARADKGALFENFAIAERLKFLGNTRSLARSWFWRTTAAQEIDYLEELDGKLCAYEVKLKPKRKASAPLSFRNAYPGVDFKKITTSNFEAFVL